MSEVGKKNKRATQEVIWYNLGEPRDPDDAPYISVEQDNLRQMPKIGRAGRLLIGLLEAPHEVQEVLRQQAAMVYNEEAGDEIPVPRVSWHSMKPVTLHETVSREHFTQLLATADMLPRKK